MSNKSGTSPQAVPLPTGGGALAGIGETFTPDLFSGTGSFTVPLDLPVGRNGFQPSLNLTYDTGEGNGPFGLGWSMSVPSVRRKTSDGVPRYRDGSDPGSDEDADVFLFSGAEDLVPVTRPEPGTTRYRPRTEGLFARVDRIRTEGSDTWELRTRDGHVNRFGGHGPGSGVVVADPANRSRIFCWPLVETSDPFGNRIVYEYRRDTGSEGPHQWDQLYLDRVRYVDFEQDGTIRFLISVSFVYDDRPDPFSDHRSGFEIRTRLRCRRIEIRTHADGNLLTHSYELEYLDDLVQRGERPASDLPPNRVSLLSRIRVVGHDGDRTQQLPPIELDYTRFRPDRRRFQPLQAEGNTLPPVSLADDELETVDLFGNGLPDIVQLNGSVRFWRNLGDGRFARPQDMDRVPAGLHLGDPGVQFADMNGDGRADLLALARQGYFPLGGDGRWSEDGLVRYPTAPVVSFGADDIRLVDLDGDGVVDALRTGSVFELFFNDRDAGWERVETRPRRPAAEFPDVSFSDPRVKLADLTGDGLQDIVLVQQGRIDYWPYRGHGSWGRRVTMDASPTFRNAPGTPGGFDPRRVLLGDLDGDGLDDIAYVEANRVTCWINRGGNGWSEPFVIEGTPAFTDIDAVRMADVLGTGMDGVLWSNDRVPGTGSNYRFLDLTGGLKPYLLERVDNHRGAVTSLRYASSTKFYLADEARPATRWRAPLPFPVHVIEAVELVDQVSGGRLTNELRYHHGYWDGVERELRGFGMVEQLDTEVFDGDGAEAAFSPPVLTKTWFHLGPESDADEAVSEVDRSAEFWPEDDPALGHVEAINQYLATLPRSVARDAQRSLRGRVLRREVYAADGPALRDRPFTVTEHAYALREESAPGPAEDGRRRIFFPHAVGERVTQWERGTEPMTTLSFTDAFDQYGLSGREIRIAVPRHRDFRRTAPAAAEHYLATVTTTTYARRDDDAYVVDRVATTTTQEIGNDGRPSAVALRDSVRAGSADLRVLDETRNYYDGPGFVGLPLGHVGRFGALTRTETLVLTEEALREGYRADADASDDDAAAVPPYLAPGSGSPRWTSEYPAEFQTSIPAQAGYTFLDGKYYAPQVRRRYDFQEGGIGRGLLGRVRDALGRDSTITYDRFGLLVVRSTDPAALVTQATYDYRVLQPRVTVDVNGNRSLFAYSPLGLLERSAITGKAGERIGDTLDAPSTRFTYDFTLPVSVRTERRVHHVNATDVPRPARDQTIASVDYSDGFGRLVQTRLQGEDVRFGDPVFCGGVLPATQGDPATGAEVLGRRVDSQQPNVVVSGWQVFDNKGRPVARYEPFVSTGFEFASPSDAELGQRVSLFYEPRGAVVRTVNPDGSETRAVHGVPASLDEPDDFRPTPWEIFTYDENDNGGRTHGSSEVVAGFDHHWDTPTSVELDALGRVVRRVERQRAARRAPDNPPEPVEELTTVITYDLSGNRLTVTDASGRVAFCYLYDQLDRLIRTESLDAGTQRLVLDAAGQEIERRDSKGAVILRAYDVVGRESRLWARDRSDAGVTLRERIDYGDGGNPRQPPVDRAAARAANRLGRVHRHYDEAGLATVVAFDFRGQVAEETRKVLSDEVVLAGGPVDWELPTGSSLDSHAAGLLDPRVYEVSRSFDALGRVRSLHAPAGSNGVRRGLTYGYTRAGDLEQILLDGAPVVERIAYDAKGQRTLVALGNGMMNRYAYDPRTTRPVRIRTERYTGGPGSGATVAYQPTGAPLLDVAYQHDLVGNVIATVDQTPASGVAGQPAAGLGLAGEPELRSLVAAGDALVRRFTYDPLYRLVSATGRECAGGTTPSTPWSDPPRCGFNRGTPNGFNTAELTQLYREDFVYDRVGNLKRQTHTGGSSSRIVRQFSLGAGANRLAALRVGSTVVAYEHDRAGNVRSETNSRQFLWDHSDRMVGFQIVAGGPSVEAHHAYGADGERVKKVVRKQDGSVASTVHIGGIFEHHRSVRPGSGETANTCVHVTDGQRRVLIAREGTPHRDDRGPDTQYALSDHLGNSTVVVDQSGAFVNREEYTPYGETSFGSFGRKRFRFNGQERDEESGLAYHGARFYAPWLARWTSADPVDPDPGATTMLSPYTGLGNNPVNLTDPGGEQPDPPDPGPGRFKRAVGWVKRTAKSKAQAARLALQLVLGKDVPEHPLPDPVPGPVQPPGPPLDSTGDSPIVKSKTEAEHLAEEQRKAKRKPGGGGGGGEPPPPPPEAGGGGAAGAAGESGSAARASRVGATASASKAAGTGRRALRFLGKSARFAGRAAGWAGVAYIAARRGYTAIGLVREGRYREAAMQTQYFVEDLNPLPNARPEKISYPQLGPDQSRFRDRIQSDNRSGCQICHDAVRVDNWFKSTTEGQTWEMVHGRATRGGFPTDEALRFFERRAFPLNSPKPQNVWP